MNGLKEAHRSETNCLQLQIDTNSNKQAELFEKHEKSFLIQLGDERNLNHTNMTKLQKKLDIVADSYKQQTEQLNLRSKKIDKLEQHINDIERGNKEVVDQQRDKIMQQCEMICDLEKKNIDLNQKVDVINDALVNLSKRLTERD
jgi:hypothetical protein